MTDTTDTIDINLLGKDYRVACAHEEQAALTAAVVFLDDKLKAIGTKTRSSGERLAVMTALNIAHELLALKAASPESISSLESDLIQRRIKSIEASLDLALMHHEQLF
ncbi:MAG: cell division protein ZapA [Rhodocyclales bacterium]|nr:cell division protein ZapA [Rhodocyclales bacterium]